MCILSLCPTVYRVAKRNELGVEQNAACHASHIGYSWDCPIPEPPCSGTIAAETRASPRDNSLSFPFCLPEYNSDYTVGERKGER